MSEELGPAMQALDERQRKFVLALVHEGKNATRAADAAGYSGKHEMSLRVRGHRLLRSKRVLAALREEAELRFGAAIPLALARLASDVWHVNRKIRDRAIVQVLDRGGYGVRTVQDIRVEHVDSRSTAELLEAVKRLMPARLSAPVIDGEFKEKS